MVLELGMGTDIQGEDYTKAAIRALQNALRQNSLTIADAFDVPRHDMHVKIAIGAQKPEQVDTKAVAAVLPYGKADVSVEHGGLDTLKANGKSATIMVNAAVVVYLDLPENKQWVVA